MPGPAAPGARWANSRLPRQPLTTPLKAAPGEGNGASTSAQDTHIKQHANSFQAANTAKGGRMAGDTNFSDEGSYHATPISSGSTLWTSPVAGAVASNGMDKAQVYRTPREVFSSGLNVEPGAQNFTNGYGFINGNSSSHVQAFAGNISQSSITDYSASLRVQQYWTPAEPKARNAVMTGMPTQEDYEKFSDRDPGSRRQSCIQSENEEIFRQVLRNVANGQPLTSPSKKSGHERKNTTVSAPAKFTPGTPSELPSGGVSVASPPNQLINQHSLGLRVDVSELSHSRRTPIVQDNLVHLTTPTSLQRIGLLNRNPSTTRSNSREAATGAYQISPLAPNGNSRAIQSISSIAYPDPNASLSRSSSGSSSGNGLLEALRRVQEGSPTPHAKTSIQQQRIITQTPLSQRSVSPIYGPLEFHPIPEEVQKVRSNWLNQLTGPNGQPTVEGMLHPANIPFIETCHLTNRANNGVVCITNIPYEITRAEVIAFLGRSARILNDNEEPIHIIMDRVTSKTNDCYVEFVSFQEAVNAVDRHHAAVRQERHPKLGDRNVDVSLSSQAKLMKELFPTAHGVDWQQSPYSFTFNAEYDFQNFKGFICAEEMNMLFKHAEANSHASYAKGCPERPFECMISTIKKMPWYLTERITIKERHYIYDVAFKMVEYLIELLERGTLRRGQKPDYNRLTKQLLNRLVKAIMLCPGFTVSQKDNVAYLVNLPERDLCDYNQPPFADGWRHLYALGVKPGAPLDVVEFYIALIRTETSRVVENLDVVRKRALKFEQRDTSDYWGFFWCEIGLPSGPAFDNMTLANVAALEWEAMEKVIRRAITGGLLPSY